MPKWVAAAVREEIERRRLSGEDLTFGHLPRRTVQSEHKRACKLAGIPDHRLHDHRHPAAVALARAGMPLNLLQGQLGHMHISQTMKYARYNPDYTGVGAYFRKVEERFGSGGAVPSGNQTGNAPGSASATARTGEDA